MLKSYVPFIGKNYVLLLFGLLSVFFGNIGQSFFISWFGADIQHSLSISSSYYGLIYAIATLASGALLMAVGGKVDKLPLTTFSKWIACGLALGCACLWYANSIVWIVVGFFLIRLCGQGLLPHIALTTMGRYFSADRGKAISIAACGVPLGEAILPSIILVLLGLLGGRDVWLLLAMAILVFYIPVSHLLLKTANKDNSFQTAVNENAHLDASRRDVLKDAGFYLALPCVLLAPFVVTGFFIQQGFVIEQQHWSSAMLASGFIVYGGLHWAASMLTGVLIDKFSARSLLPFLNIPLFIAMCTLALGAGSWQVFPVMACLGVTMGITGAVVNAVWAEAYGVTHLGAIRALATSLMVVSTAIAPWVMGIFIDKGVTSAAIFGAAAVISLLAMVAGYLAKRHFRKLVIDYIKQSDA